MATTPFNIFRILADFSHIASKLILMWAIHWNRSAEGVSLISQALYVLVFVTRYLDILWSSPLGKIGFYLFAVKLFYIASSLYIVFLMVFAYARTREREKAWKFGMYCLGFALLFAVPLCKVFEKGPEVTITGGKRRLLYEHDFEFLEILWVFSIILESVCILPQLILLRQTTVPTVIDSYYLAFLGSYRALYILNWIVRASDPGEHWFDPIGTIFGIVQTAMYVDFAWIYYTRQRVKLRNGGIVDNDDMERGWLVGRLARKHGDVHDGEGEEIFNSDGATGRNAAKWGPRGISVSADDGIAVSGEDATALTDPEAFEDELSDDEGAPAHAKKGLDNHQSPWADEGSSSAA